jgi:nucleoside-diphosphate-sugar epimerase
MAAFVTGAAGFIGLALTEALPTRGERVIGSIFLDIRDGDRSPARRHGLAAPLQPCGSAVGLSAVAWSSI